MSTITWTSYLEAGIQDKVAEFLALKSKLLLLQKHSNTNIAIEAKELYANQLVLEAELPKQLATIEKAQQEGWQFIYLAYLGTYAKKFKDHLDDSKKLIKVSKSTTALTYTKPNKYFTYAKVAAGGIIGIALIKKIF